MRPHRTLRVSTENMMLYARRCWNEIIQYKISGALCGVYEAKFVEAIDIIRSDTLKQTLFNIGYHIFINFIFFQRNTTAVLESLLPETNESSCK